MSVYSNIPESPPYVIDHMKSGGFSVHRIIYQMNILCAFHQYIDLKILYIMDGHQNLKLLLIDPNQMYLIGFVERTILVFKSSKSDVSLQSYGLIGFLHRAARTL